MLESDYQALLVKKLEDIFPGCFVLNNNANQIQGFPDLTILYKNTWVALECKRNIDSPAQPNQEYYVRELNDMSYSAFICPEIESEVLDEVREVFEAARNSRFSFSKYVSLDEL